ncbi:acyl-CoA synthetase [Bordetella flabilis]|uniref:Acyl-CoA synthetase n=2 Tax=Bordetella flabilis TaxID=463014 RepID=A0A193GFM4_9BORD|nr:acyl-CoA synthetase [Bordetella flabilis]
MPPPAWRDHDTFAARLEAWARAEPQRIALIDDDVPITVSSLRDDATRLAGGLASLGVKPGQRVALWLPNGADWVVSFLACARIGALVLAVNTRFRARELADVLGRGGADWLIYWPDFKDIRFDAILDDVPLHILQRLRGVFMAGTQALPAASRQLSGSAAIASGGNGPHEAALSDVQREGRLAGIPAYGLRALMQHGPAAPAAAPNAPAICFTTSGTTSLPKFVVHDQRTLLRHGDAVARRFGHDATACILGTAPFCGVFGFAALAGGLAPGVPVVCQAVFEARRAADAVSRHRVTHAYLNNEALLRMLDAAPDHDYASVRLFGFATFAPALDTLPARAAVHGIALTGLYGSSELIALVAAQPLDDAARRFLPGGRLIYPEARVRVRDPGTGRVLPPGESGEIEIRSPSQMLGYLDDTHSSAQALTDDGYFRTGDLGYAVNDRHFVFQARLGDTLRLSGFLVNPAEIEAFLASLPGIHACQVVGADRDGKTVAFAFVLLEPDTEPDPQGWRDACRQAMAGFKVPAGFHVLQSFPTVESANSVKIQKGRLRELANELLQADRPAP